MIPHIGSLSTTFQIQIQEEFHPIYNLGAVLDSDELFRFWNQKQSYGSHNQTSYGQKVEAYAFIAFHHILFIT